jgi:putative photosynthetic complex assembly protein
MSAAQTQRPSHGVPLGVLVGAALLIAFTMSAAFYSHVSGVGRVALQGATPYQVLQLWFEDKPNGGVAVRDATRGDVIYAVEPGAGGFLRATLRTMVQARKRDDIGPATPFRLTRWSDGALSLDDPTTGRTVGLDAFGADNAGVFAQLFKKREEIK